MNKIGQAEAMEDGGLDLTHYTPVFAELLFTDWYKNFIRPRMGTPTPQPAVPKLAGEESVESIETLWDSGSLRDASCRVRDVLRRHPQLPAPEIGRASCRERGGQYV